MKTEIFKNYKAFLDRPDKSINGVTAEFAAKNPSALLDVGNSDCWNCTKCAFCSNCVGCIGCNYCTSCSDCTRCSDCKKCIGCTHCVSCIEHNDCEDCWGSAKLYSAEQRLVELDTQLDTVTAERDRLLKDKARLDWLDEEVHYKRAEGIDQYWIESIWTISTEVEEHDLRAAIDAAMRGEGGQGE